ncbi:MAG: PhoH family protein [Kofleriaceae bacterium]|nr:PhoH family protein [Kofleriaceae bacterium]MCB9575102.1 PhoH family protein [Kofleriaceae bacterium]
MTKPLRRDKLAFDDPTALQALCGTNNARLKLVERTAGVELHLRGNEITIEADEAGVEVAKAALEQLYAFARKGKNLASDDVVRAVKVLRADHRAHIADIFGEAILTPRAGRPVAPKGLAQKRYVDAVRACDIVFGVGPAGTGKTYLAMALAVRALLDKQVRRIILTRPAVEAGEKLGFLPGTLEEKVDPYLRPLYDALHDMLEADRIQRLITEDVIEVAPLAFMRGRTLNDCFVILDEAQNTTPEQMKMFLTRLGFGGKAVVTGDPSQTDLPRGHRSGLRDALDLLGDIRGIAVCWFDDHDVVRHPLVADIVRAYDARDRSRSARPDGGDGPDGDDRRGGGGRGDDGRGGGGDDRGDGRQRAGAPAGTSDDSALP